ncbi:MAG: nuclear transport factor 2 family protein [Gammaproteobacteria bacterium]|nr:nuclear transport factor 2 family protein [Gammaproteobacteria bacterium]
MKNTLLSAALFAATAGLLSGGAQAGEVPAADGMEDIRAVVEANQAAWREALNASDVEGLVDTYSADAVLMPPTDETLADAASIRRYLRTLAASGLKHNGVDLYEIRREGDTVYAAGVWSATRPAAGGAELIGGNIVTVFERQSDGRWKTRLQTWN